MMSAPAIVNAMLCLRPDAAEELHVISNDIVNGKINTPQAFAAAVRAKLGARPLALVARPPPPPAPAALTRRPGSAPTSRASR